jgi:hypothetical protein
MRSSSTLQYLHYIEQIGLALSPMSNNALFLAYERYMRISAPFSPTKGMRICEQQRPLSRLPKVYAHISIFVAYQRYAHMSSNALFLAYDLEILKRRHVCVFVCCLATGARLTSSSNAGSTCRSLPMTRSRYSLYLLY